MIARLIQTVRRADFLSAERARAYAIILAVLMSAALVFDWVSTAIGHHPWGKIDGPPGKPQATDFLAFWAAGREVWAGQTAAAYDLTALSVREHAAAIMDPAALLAFFYPPTFLLLCLPFAALPYIAGLAAFVGVSLAALAAGLRRILPAGWGLLPVVAFPGLLMNAATGQNGFWSASCFAWALLWMETRPALAGACLGMLVIKPHLALVIPAALLAARRWRALVACAASAAVWIGLSWIVLGNAAWHGFFAAAPAIRDALEAHREDWSKLQSLYTTLRLSGAAPDAAYLAQFGLAMLVIAAVVVLAWRRPDAAGEVALMTAASTLCTPHLLDYDLAATSVPLAWIATQAAAAGWMPWEKAGAALAFLWPLVARQATQSGFAPVAPLILLILFALVCRRNWNAVPLPGHNIPSHAMPMKVAQ